MMIVPMAEPDLVQSVEATKPLRTLFLILSPF